MSTTYATDTNLDTNNSQNSIVNKDTNVNTAQQSVQNSNTNNTLTNTSTKAAGEPEKLTQNQILAASKTVNNFITKNKKLPNSIKIGGYTFSMNEYAYLISKTIHAKYNKKTNQITIKYNIMNPPKASGVTIKGKLTRAQYYTLSRNLYAFMDKNNRAPNFLSTKLGKMQYQTVIFTLNRVILFSSNNRGALPSSVSVNIGKSHTLNKNLPPILQRNQALTAVNSGSSRTISQSLIWSTSASVKSFIDRNKRLPDFVTISGNKYSMPEFLYLLSKAINTRVGGSTGAIVIKSNIINPSNPNGASINKKFTRTQYNDMAKRIVSHINSNNRAPNFLSAKYGVGNIQYQTVIYGLSCVGSHIHSKKAVPSSLTIKVANSHSMNKYLPVYISSSPINNSNPNTNTSNTNNTSSNNNTTNQNGLTTTLLGSDDKGKVELIGTFGNPNSNVKIAYVIGMHPLESQVHNVLQDLVISKRNSLNYCYYIYKITVTKNPNNYNEGKMNGQLLAQSYALPHLLNNNYNLVIDVHSNQGLVGGTYDETQFIFAPLNHNTSKQIAENIIRQIPALSYYYPTAQTSPPYLTEPLVKAGIPTILFETFIYEDKTTTTNLVNQLITKIDSYNFTSISTDSTGVISLNSIIDASSRVKTFVETNGVLPNHVTIGTIQYSMPNFLYLLSTAIKNIASGSTSGVKPITVSAAPSPSGATIAGTLSRVDYVDLATRVSNFIATNNRAPNNAGSSLGSIQFQSLVYELSKVLNHVNSNGALPNTLTINTSNPRTLNSGSGSGEGSFTGSLNEKNTLSNSELARYLQATTNCQVNNPIIQSLAANLTRGLTTELEKATAIFNYVKNNIKYVYYTETRYGAVNTLNAKGGNCVDQTHLLIALLRASGLAARYVHADCTFSSGNRIGHVFAQVLIGDTWVVADTTHSANRLGTITNWNTNTYTLKGQGKSVTISF